MENKKIIMELLKDSKHWLGWILTTLIVLTVYVSLISLGMNNSILIILLIFVTIVIVDIIKHLLKLQ